MTGGGSDDWGDGGNNNGEVMKTGGWVGGGGSFIHIRFLLLFSWRAEALFHKCMMQC